MNEDGSEELKLIKNEVVETITKYLISMNGRCEWKALKNVLSSRQIFELIKNYPSMKKFLVGFPHLWTVKNGNLILNAQQLNSCHSRSEFVNCIFNDSLQSSNGTEFTDGSKKREVNAATNKDGKSILESSSCGSNSSKLSSKMSKHTDNCKLKPKIEGCNRPNIFGEINSMEYWEKKLVMLLIEYFLHDSKVSHCEVLERIINKKSKAFLIEKYGNLKNFLFHVKCVFDVKENGFVVLRNKIILEEILLYLKEQLRNSLKLNRKCSTNWDYKILIGLIGILKKSGGCADFGYVSSLMENYKSIIKENFGSFKWWIKSYENIFVLKDGNIILNGEGIAEFLKCHASCWKDMIGGFSDNIELYDSLKDCVRNKTGNNKFTKERCNKASQKPRMKKDVKGLKTFGEASDLCKEEKDFGSDNTCSYKEKRGPDLGRCSLISSKNTENKRMFIKVQNETVKIALLENEKDVNKMVSIMSNYYSIIAIGGVFESCEGDDRLSLLSLTPRASSLESQESDIHRFKSIPIFVIDVVSNPKFLLLLEPLFSSHLVFLSYNTPILCKELYNRINTRITILIDMDVLEKVYCEIVQKYSCSSEECYSGESLNRLLVSQNIKIKNSSNEAFEKSPNKILERPLNSDVVEYAAFIVAGLVDIHLHLMKKLNNTIYRSLLISSRIHSTKLIPELQNQDDGCFPIPLKVCFWNVLNVHNSTTTM